MTRRMQFGMESSSADNYDFLPPGFAMKTKSGISVQPDKTKTAFSVFWKELSTFCEYRVYLSTIPSGAETLATTKNADALGAMVKYPSGGHLVLLPHMNFRSLLSEPDGQWKDEAKGVGHRLIKCLSDIDSALRANSSRTPPPGWLGFVMSPSEIRANDQVLAQEEHALSELAKSGLAKRLLFETGDPLEEAILSALRLLGFTAENFNDGSSEFDAVFESAEGRFIGEAEGKDTSAIAIGKFDQLYRNIMEDFSREEIEVQAKGVLFGNGYRLTNPDSRSCQFTTKCISAAEKQSIALVQCSDLYKVVVYLEEHDDEAYKTACRKAMLEQTKIVRFPCLPTEGR